MVVVVVVVVMVLVSFSSFARIIEMVRRIFESARSLVSRDSNIV